ncbi:polyphenol oxidase I, chloroplastic-like [Andrographis paniculata]|uniref:polyphenol oxidase I, chloroplastic-like n=1 Tax=Andrographis paniculata TaxID=175694 RepID=UPI0021E79D83|nr:polyphenol oxidase I, chloroplastic-like [Andrographis paniculata]
MSRAAVAGDRSTHSTPTRRFHVSCNQQKLDRRNMLLGLGGGLYGAANLAVSNPPATAAPIGVPEFTACGEAHDVQSNDLLPVNCCPPVSGTPYVDYKLPPARKTKVRPAAHKVSREYLAKYEEAMRRMRELDRTDPTDPRGFMQQANIHCAYCNGAHDQPGYPNLDIQIHNSWLFFPFHRWYLYFYERILGSLIDDPDFAIPFWNWDNPKGMQMPAIFDRDKSPIYNVNRNPDHRGRSIIDLGFSRATDEIQLVVNNLSVVHNEMIRSVNSTLDFMGAAYRAGDPPGNGGSAGSSERGSHVSAHVWVGNPANKYREDMGNFYSAGRDPLFYCHHANVDRLWKIWTGLKTDVPKSISDPDFLNAGFLFYNEKKELVRVKVADCLNMEKLGYDYERVDTPWLNYRPSKKAAAADIKKLAANAEAAEKIFPLTLNKIVRVLVPKSAKGKADEVLVLEDIETDSTKFIKFDIFINDEDDIPSELDRAEYAGTFAQVPHRTKEKKGKTSINLKLTDVYEDIEVGDDDTIVVTIIPRSNGDAVTIGGIKVIPSPPRSA